MSSNMSQYLEQNRKGKTLPDDPFKHATNLMENEQENVAKFTELVDKKILLANISEDRMMRLYQNDIVLLTELFDMAQREPQLKNFFCKIYYGWTGELSLTRTKDGTERKLQAVPGGSYAPKEQLSGYGMNLPQFTEQEDEKNILAKIFQRNKK